MKKKFNKRLLSAALAIVMLITAVPIYAVKSEPKAESDVLLTVEGDSAYAYLDGFFVVKNDYDNEKAEVSYVDGNFKEAKKLGEFKSARYADNYGLAVTDFDGKKLKLFPNGKTYSGVYEYSDSLLKVFQSENGSLEFKYGLIDKNGNQVIECVWDGITSLTEDYSVLTAYGENGYVDGTAAIVDSDGKIILDSIKTNYIEVIADNGDDVIFAFSDGKSKLFFPESGKVLISGAFEGGKYDEETGLILVKNDDGLYGYADGQGNVVIGYQYAAAGDFSEGVAAVCDKTTMLWGYIGPDGNTVLDFNYTYADSFSEGLAFVKENEVLPEEPSSEEVTDEPSSEEPSSEEVSSEPDVTEEPSSEDVSTEESTAEEITDEPVTDEITEITEESAVIPELYAETKEVKKFIDKSGETAFELPEKVLSAEPYYGGYAIVTNDNWQHGLIDKKGDLTVPYGDKTIFPYEFGAYTITRGGSDSDYLIINGKVTDIETTESYRSDDEYIVAVKDGKYGIINSKLETVVGFEYDEIDCNVYSAPWLFAVKKDGKWAAVDKEGNRLTDYRFDAPFYENEEDGHTKSYVVSSDGTVYEGAYAYNDNAQGIVNENGQFGLINKENGELLLGGKFFDYSGRSVTLLDNICVIESSSYENTLVRNTDGTVISRDLGYYFCDGDCIVSESGLVYDTNGNKIYYLPTSVEGYNFDYSSYSNIFTVTDMEWMPDGNTKNFVKFVKARPYDIEKIEITQLPNKTEFIENVDGDRYDESEPFRYSVSLEGLIIEVTYTDGTSETVTFDYNNNAFSYYDEYYFEGVGEYTIPFSYLGMELSFNVKVIENPLTKIEVVTDPAQTEYLSGGYPDLNGAVLRFTYNDGTTAEVTLIQNTARYNEYYDAFLGREELIEWRWENPEVSESLEVSGKQNIIISYLGKEITFAVDVLPNLTESIKLSGGHSDNLVITATNSDGTSNTFTVLDFKQYGRGEDVVGGALVTDKGIFDSYICYQEWESELELFGKRGAIPDKCTFLDVARVSQDFEFFAGGPFGINLTSFTGSVTKENIDAVVLVAFYNADGMMKFEAEYDEEKDAYVYLVPKADAEKYVKGMFEVNGAIDFTLSKNYDKASGKISVPDLAYGYGPLTTEKTYRFENGLWYAECDGYPVGKITTVYDFDSGKITAYYFNEREVESVKVHKNPNKYEYIQGEPINTAGLELEVLYSDGTTQIVTKGFETKGYDPNKLGEQNVKVVFSGKETSFKVKVVEKRPPQPETPDKITSDKYKIENGYILDIPAGTSVDMLLKGINERAYVKVFKGNTEVTGNTLVGTKMVVKLMDGTHIKQSLILSVRGDNSGEGLITITDMIAVKSHLLGKTTLNGAAFYASDVNRDKKVTITDFIQVKSHLLGKSQIK